MSAEAPGTVVPPPDLQALQESLQQQIDNYKDQRLQRRLLPREEQVVKSLEDQLKDVKRRLAEQVRTSSGTAATPNAPASPNSSPPDVPPPSTSTAALHPIETVAGQAVRLEDVIGATLDDGDHAFSASTRTALERAANVPIGSTTDGAAVIGPASFLRAVLSIGAEEGTGHVVAGREHRPHVELRRRTGAQPAPPARTAHAPPDAHRQCHRERGSYTDAG